jgi:hypothetical protein
VVDAGLTTLGVTEAGKNWIPDSLVASLAEHCDISRNYVNKISSHAVEKVIDAGSVYTHKFSFVVNDYSQEMRFGMGAENVFYFAFATSPSRRGLLKFDKSTGETVFEYLNVDKRNESDTESHVHTMRLYVEPAAAGGSSTILFSKTNGGAAVVLGKPGEAGQLQVALVNSPGTGRTSYSSRIEVKGCVDAVAGIPVTCATEVTKLVSEYDAFKALDGRNAGKGIPELYLDGWHLLTNNPTPGFSSRETALGVGL